MSHLDHLLKHHFQNRKVYRSFLSAVSTENANKIPEGFNNNIIWNCGHVITVQQFFMYTWCGKTPVVDQEIFAQFAIGTKPEKQYDDQFIMFIKDELIRTSVKMDEDLKNEDFIPKKPFTTSIKTELTNAEELISFINFHEGLHIGAAISLMKFL